MSQYFKRLSSLLSQIYEEFPQMRRHPEYRFFYLHWGYSEPRDYFFVLTNNIPESENDDFLSFINTTSRTFGFIEGVIMKPDDFKKHIVDVMEESAKDLRGSEFKVFGYEVW
jgi:hypothetical protein